jgi:magnesium chelatase subunit I
MITPELKEKILQADFSDIVGQDKVKSQLKSAMIAQRHVILVGQPGIGKTTLARNIAKLLPKIEKQDFFKQEEENKEELKQSPFVRVQGSPDLTSEDLIGDIDPIKAMKFGPLSPEAFTPGKIFKAHKGVLFFDEINRCSEKLQNALLQVLEEKKVTIGSYSMDFEVDFFLIGTMNPDDKSTEPLSDVFLDRFDLIYVDYPDNTQMEMDIVKNSGKQMVEFPENTLMKVVEFIRGLRSDRNVEKKPSVRASIGLYERAQTNALVNGRDKVTLKDVSEVIVSVLSHRICLKASIKYLKKPEDFIEEEYEKFLSEMGEYP